MNHCKSCGRPLRWMQTPRGRRLPLDPDPVPDGNVLLLPNGRCRVVPADQRDACVAPLFKSHFATCPNADMHRSHR